MVLEGEIRYFVGRFECSVLIEVHALNWVVGCFLICMCLWGSAVSFFHLIQFL